MSESARGGDRFRRCEELFHAAVALEDALQRLAALDERKGRVVELKFFGGLTTEEIAEVLQVSGATVEREWAFARAWLYDAVEGSGGGSAAGAPR